ncbi:MAG: hypothetical protein RLZ45_1216 [Verrucomicrobiota bacterium]|jgi:hypothetical protein
MLAWRWVTPGNIGSMQRKTFRLWVELGLLLGVALTTRAAELQVVAVWDFNTPGVLQASQGSGEVRTLGGVSSTHLTGAPSDPASPNTSFGLKGFPAQGTANRSAGVEFRLDGAFSELALAFDARVSTTACARLAVLVDDGAGEFQEAGILDVKLENAFVPLALDLSGVLDPLGSGPTCVRIVADMGGDGLYPTVKPRSDGANPYSPLGVWRLDRVAFRGVVRKPAEEPLHISVCLMGEGLALDWSPADAERFTLWKAPSPSGPWTSAAIVYDTRSIESMDEMMRFYRVTSP